MRKQPAVYILASGRNGTLYVGVTSDLQKRIWEHKNDLVEGFTKRYSVHRLVYYRVTRRDGVSHNEREADQEMETGLEAEPYRGTKSRMERFVGKASLKENKRLDSRFRGNDG
jgi:predicted GIY-YIG superfamily endonuclease